MYSTKNITINSVIATSLWFVALACVIALGSEAHHDYNSLKSVPSVGTVTTHSAEPSQKPTSIDYSQIHLFGKAGAEPKIEIKKDIPVTRLNLVLKGAFTSSSPDRASALISEKNKPSVRYFIDDKLPGGAILHQVDKDFVTLSRSGQLEILRFPDTNESETLSRRSDLTISPHRDSKRVISNSRAESIKERLKRLRQNKQ